MNKYRTAYFAGIIDGEGSISMTSNGKGRQKRLSIEVKMTCKKTIDAIHKHFGVGHVTARPSTNKKWADQWRWRATCKAARFVINEVKPYLITKQHLT